MNPTAFFAAPDAYRRAAAFISEHRLTRYLIWPGLISLGLGIGLAVLAFRYGRDLGYYLAGLYPEGWWGGGVIDEIVAVLAIVLALGGFLFLFKYIVVIVAAPFVGPLSERVECELTGKPPLPFSLKNTAQDTARAIRISLRNLTREIFYTLLLLLLNFVPVVGTLAAPVLIFLVQAFYAGFGNFDPVLERKRLNVRQRVGWVRGHRSQVAGNGAVFLLLLMIPVVGWFLAPAYGATAAVMQQVGVEGASTAANAPPTP